MPAISLRDDYDAAEFRALAKRGRDVRQARRLLALAAVYDGMSRAEAARIGGQDRRHGSADVARLGASLQRRRA